jgi:hypothetical protein
MSTLAMVRRGLLAVLILGVLWVGVDLLLIEHYEDPLQLAPLTTIAIALIVIVWHIIRYDAASIRAFQSTMVLFLVAGTAGMGLHFRGGAEFQLEMDPTRTGWDIFTKVMRAKAPPVLSAGVLMQLGLLGLVYAYRHPALDR